MAIPSNISNQNPF